VTSDARSEPALPETLAAEVNHLVKKGEHAAAAAALWAHGHPRRAGQIYESIFEHKKAMNAFEAASDVVGAVRSAIEVPDLVALDRLVTLAIATGKGDELLVHLVRSGRAAEEARVRLARGEPVLAAEAFERAGSLDRAAHAMEEAGKPREAGLLLERHLEDHADDVEGALRLGRILSRFGRHDDAIRVLQAGIRAASVEPMGRARFVVRAAPTLLLSFVQLGYEHAAEEVLTSWGRAHGLIPSTERGELEAPPTSLEQFLASERAAALAAIQAAPKSGSQPPVPAPDAGLDALLGADGGSSGDAGDEGVAVEVDAPRHEQGARATTIDDTLLLGGRYLLGEPLGGGGVGQVFRAFDAFSDRSVAVKIFGAQALASDAVKEYAREARAFAELRHPAVAALVELNVAQGFVVTELVSGGLLEDKLVQGGPAGWLPLAMRSLLDLLATCHRTGLVHGGLKPTNVFVLDAGVRVVDVGAHRLLALRSTETGGLASVWPYLAPEQLFGAPASSIGDLYAVGAMMYRALTGRPPFARIEDDRRLAPPAANIARASIDAAWTAFLARALHPDPAQRFADAAEMAAAMPPLRAESTLPTAAALAGAEAARGAGGAISGQASRYAKGGLVDRPREGVRVYEGTDLTLDRAVWLIEADDTALLKPLIVCARLWRGVQPVYDVIPDAHRVVLARDAAHAPLDFAALRTVPQGLARDLAGVGAAIEWLHGQGWALGGFPIERALGPVGPRLRLAPAPLPQEASVRTKGRDWDSFGALVDAAFDLRPDRTLDGRGRVLAMLHDTRLLDRADLDALGAEAQALTSWPAFLDAVVARLVQGSSSRVVARLVANVLRGA
jgi:serine/threonine-protein kinase